MTDPVSPLPRGESRAVCLDSYPVLDTDNGELVAIDQIFRVLRWHCQNGALLPGSSMPPDFEAAKRVLSYVTSRLGV